MQLEILLELNSFIILVEKKKQENEAAINKRTTKRIIDIVARVLRNTRYVVLFLVENELAHVL